MPKNKQAYWDREDDEVVEGAAAGAGEEYGEARMLQQRIETHGGDFGGAVSLMAKERAKEEEAKVAKWLEDTRGAIEEIDAIAKGIESGERTFDDLTILENKFLVLDDQYEALRADHSINEASPDVVDILPTLKELVKEVRDNEALLDGDQEDIFDDHGADDSGVPDQFANFAMEVGLDSQAVAYGTADMDDGRQQVGAAFEGFTSGAEVDTGVVAIEAPPSVSPTAAVATAFAAAVMAASCLLRGRGNCRRGGRR